MAWTTPSTVVAGQTLSAAFWNEQVRDNLDVLEPLTEGWTSYTPTLVACTAPITYAKYLKVGRTVAFSVLLTLTGAQVSGYVTIGLPFTMAQATTGIFQLYFLDSGSAWYPGIADVFSGTTVGCVCLNTSGTYAVGNNISATVPFTWASGDRICLGGVYETAS